MTVVVGIIMESIELIINNRNYSGVNRISGYLMAN